MARTPAWVEKLVRDACEAEAVEVPVVAWRRARPRTRGLFMYQPEHSSGHYYPKDNRVVVTAGTSRIDARLVLLHELAHHIRHVRATNAVAHDDTFWVIAWRLYLANGIRPKYALAREANYRVAAVRVAIELGIHGAKATERRRIERRNR